MDTAPKLEQTWKYFFCSPCVTRARALYMTAAEWGASKNLKCSVLPMVYEDLLGTFLKGLWSTTLD